MIDSRLAAEGAVVRRRRECTACSERFTTLEQVELSYPNLVKQDGTREAFSEPKLRAGVQRALEKRPVDTELVDDAIQRIKHHLHAAAERELPTSRVGNWVMDELKKLDKVAYIRFASVYRSFKDTDEFLKEIEELEKNI